ncbi:MAG: hypothetical protein ABGY95_00050, partial [Rubritalea sp.]|uniref:hypothetical protein n=1 Tax=Rubritalea sp. TaxID=2109375 RepID=UPI003242ED33
MLNGYKISGPTVFGRMDDDELQKLFEGYGYEPHFVDEEKGDPFEQMDKVMNKCHALITKIQKETK